MSILTNSCHLVLLVTYVGALIIPEELPSILSLIYSNIPPIKKGTDSRVGVGFRLGDHADFQVLLEIGPQTNTQPLGPANDGKKRRQTQRPVLVVQPATDKETVADTPGGKWLSSWRSALINPQITKSSKYATIEDQQVIVNPMEGKDHITSHLHQLYKSGNQKTENASNKNPSNNVEGTDSGLVDTNNSTTMETQPSEN